MPAGGSSDVMKLDKQGVIHVTRITIGALISLLVAQLFKLPESYWAAITTLVVTQSTFGAAFKVSWQRFVGTAIGAAAGALLATYFGENIFIFAVGVFALGILCSALNLDIAAYRFAGITLAITMLVTHTNAAWIISLHRFIEVSLGIAVALALTAVWPEASAKSE
ncbi:MAG: FUSC family protein [Candidatus Acidiferrales bacterium]